MTEQVDLELPAPLGDRQRFDRSVDRDSRVVDQRAQWQPLRIVLDAFGDGCDVRLDGDVQNVRLDPVAAEPRR